MGPASCGKPAAAPPLLMFDCWLPGVALQGDVFTEVERRGGQLTEAEAVRQVSSAFSVAIFRRILIV